jgi:microcystin-dependent protein
MAKKLFYLIVPLLCLSVALQAQTTANSGRGFDYKAVVRTPEGFLKANEQVKLRFGLYSLEVGEPNWLETHTVTTTDQGIVALRVGKGIKVSSASTITDFNQLDFERQGRWLKVEIEDAGQWKTISFEELPIVPYALSNWSFAGYPPGAIMVWAGEESKIPQGWYLCDGRELNRLEYPALYNAIGTNWGYDKATGKFRIPDLRGYFLCGYTTSTSERFAKYTGGNLSGVGSYQNDGIQSHNHSFLDVGASSDLANYDPGDNQINVEGTTSRTTGAAGGSETRPKNVYVHYIIKY